MRPITFVLCVLVAACTSSSPQACVTNSECADGFCVNGICEVAGDDGGEADSAIADAGVSDIPVVDSASDAPLSDAADTPDVSMDALLVRRDAGPVPTYVRREGATPGNRSGNPLEIGRYIVWMQQNTSATVTWYDRMTEDLTILSVSGEYSQRSTAVVHEGNAWVAWERTLPMGMPGGVSLTNLGRAPTPMRPLSIDLVGALGHPRALVVEGTLIVVAESSATRQIAAFVIDEASVTRSEALLGEGLVDAVAMEGGFVYATREDVRVVRTADWTIEDPIPIDGRVHGVALLGGRIFVGCSVGAEAFVRSYTMGGTMLAEVQIPVADPANDPRIASDGQVILAAGRLPGGAALFDLNLDEVQPLEALAPNPFLGVTSQGFVAVASGEAIEFLQQE